MTKVSVIVPVYGVEKYIERCARSLFEQTLDDIEFIFVDDCSVDSSVQLLLKTMNDYPNRNKQVTIHRMPQNSGQAKVRETGIKLAKGEYIIHCDSDDWIEPKAYETLYNKAKSDDDDMLFFDFIMEKEGVSTHVNNIIYSNVKNTINRLLLDRSKASLWLVLVKKSLYEREEFSHPKFDMAEDFTAIVQLCYLSKKIGYIETPFYHYCINQMSLSKEISETRCLKRYNDLYGNVRFLCSFFKLMNDKSFKDALFIRMYEVRFMLDPIANNLFYFKMWISHEGSFWRYFISPLPQNRNKLKTFKFLIGFPLYADSLKASRVYKALKPFLAKEY
ncbi:MAG: glycosyltransferase [Bacteroidales bacterium]|nr:glycosyltransferase [Candidatus Physcocola equi]